MTSKITALIVAAGSGSRMGGDPKQFMDLGGKAVIAHSYRRFRAHSRITDTLVVIGEGQESLLLSAVGEVPYVVGGATRRESVLNGLEWIAANGGCDLVLIHDAARPLVPSPVIDRIITALANDPGAVPTMLVADTLARGAVEDGGGGRLRLALSDTVDRADLVRVQTPQGFSFVEILKAHRAWPEVKDATDDAQILRQSGRSVALVEGDPLLEKITWPGDIPYLEAQLASTLVTRTGMGFDVHAFAGDGPIVMGGLTIPHDRGLAGHSDADVVLHSITDALLGAAGLGDIGQHFPPSDPRWRGADSAIFLAHAASLIRERGGIIDHVDCTVICEAPKVGPHREPMRARVAEILGVAASQVSVKATTTERLGFTGRGEGIAAQALATVRMPIEAPTREA